MMRHDSVESWLSIAQFFATIAMIASLLILIIDISDGCSCDENDAPQLILENNTCSEGE